MDRRSVLAALAASAASTGFAPRAAKTSTPDLIAAWLAPFVRARDFSGVVAVQRENAKPAIYKGGRAKLEARRSVDLDTKFGVESVSKLFTVEALMALREAGKLSFDDPLSRWLPDFPSASAITLRMLAQHQAGLARDLVGFEAHWAEAHSLEALVEACSQTPPAGKPGGQFVYSNNGYRVLARVIELAGGSAYGDIVRDKVLRPRGMTETREWSLHDVVPGLAQGYTPTAAWRSLDRAHPVDMTNFRGAASYCSTVGDLLRFAASRPAAPAGGTKPFTSDGHDGRGHGFICLCYRYPVEKTSIVVAGNIESGVFDSLKAGLEQIAFKRELPALKPPPETPLVKAVSADMFGSYDLFGTRLVLGRDDHGGYFVDAGDGPQPLSPIGEAQMFFRLRYATITFVKDASGAKLKWAEPAGAFELKKLA